VSVKEVLRGGRFPPPKPTLVLIQSLFPRLVGLPGHLPESQESRDAEEAVLAAAAAGQAPIHVFQSPSFGTLLKSEADALTIRILWDAGYRTIPVFFLDKPPNTEETYGRNLAFEDDDGPPFDDPA
jgi:hypothetical protein